jgi:hypothetical protein
MISWRRKSIRKRKILMGSIRKRMGMGTRSRILIGFFIISRVREV